MQDNPYNLTVKQIQRCDNLIDTAFESVSKTDANLLKNDNARDYLDFRRSSMEDGHPLTYNYKLNKLFTVIDAFIPNNLKQIIHESENKSEIALLVKVATDAIQKSNLMQGHNAAEKYVTSTVSYDSAKLDAAISELREKHAKA
jgi:hypothetical protein